MNLTSFLLTVGSLISLGYSTAAQLNGNERPNCKQANVLQFTTCLIPKPYTSDMERKSHCETTLRFINCMSDLLSNVCESKDPKVIYFLSTMKDEIQIYKNNYRAHCQNLVKSSKTTIDPRRNAQAFSYSIADLNSENGLEQTCGDIKQYKCESRSLYRTCGYPAANPKSNHRAYCNEMRAYLKCSKCKVFKCKLQGNIEHITIQEKAYIKSCADIHQDLEVFTVPTTTIEASKPTMSKIRHTTGELIVTTTTTTTSSTTSTTHRTTTTTPSTTTTTEAVTTTSATTLSTTLSIESILNKISLGNFIEHTTKSRLQSITITVATSTTSTKTTTMTPVTTTTATSESIIDLFKSDLNSTVIEAKTNNSQLESVTTTTATISKAYKTNDTPILLVSEPSNELLQSEPQINSLHINFDNINIAMNSIEVESSQKDVKFQMDIVNRTDIFKGIREGAVFLHPNTGFLLNLAEHANDFCLSSRAIEGGVDEACARGWSVSFWFKIFNRVLFDKTMVQVDNREAGKIFAIKVSSHRIRIQFLYESKLWSVEKELVWLSEWSMLTVTWTEFEGLTVYVNNKLISYQQSFEYYSPQADQKTSMFEEELAESQLVKRNLRLDSNKPGALFIGFNNRIPDRARAFFWNYETDAINGEQNSPLTESILLDELDIKNYRLKTRDITKNYLKSYYIKNEFDPVDETMYMTSLDNKHAELVLAQGALVKKSLDDNWYLNLKGPEKRFAMAPNTFDSCILDPHSLCPFGFTISAWIKFSLNNMQMASIQRDRQIFKQILFFTGSNDLANGLELIFYILPSETGPQKLDYMLKVNYKLNSAIISKSFQVQIQDISMLNELNCLTITYTTSTDRHTLQAKWLRTSVKTLSTLSDDKFTFRSTYKKDNYRSYGIRMPTLTSSNSISIFGDPSQESFFKVKSFIIKNYAYNNDEEDTKSAAEFNSANPLVSFQFNGLEGSVNKITKKPPQIIETRYGKSMLFSQANQHVTLRSNQNQTSCYNDMDHCQNGYTLKLWLCFTNYNQLKNQATEPTQNTLIYIVTKSDLQVVYDLKQSVFSVLIRDENNQYKSSISFKLKLYMWYTLTISWERRDGLRVYVNSKQVDHVAGVVAHRAVVDESKKEQSLVELTLGRAVGFEDLDEVLDGSSNSSSSDPNLSNYYELVVHRIVQYDARKYPDEMISNTQAFQAAQRRKVGPAPITWLWYAIPGVFCLMLLAIASTFGLVLKHRSKNGFWSREEDVIEPTKSKTIQRCFSIFNKANKKTTDFTNQQSFSKPNLELKRCNVKEERFVSPTSGKAAASGHLSMEEYLNNSLYGTINRLISTTQQQQNTSASLSMSSGEHHTHSCVSRNYNSIRNSTSYILPLSADNDSAEIHF